jgi:5-hydroxyisourate hydrolase-like protein (transthyretin family)
LSLTPAAATVTAGAGLVLRGRCKLLSGPPIAGTPVELQQLADDRASTIAAATTAPDGSWSITLPVSRAITLRALHRPAPAAASNVVSIAVRPRLTLTLQSVSPPRVSGSITPPKATVTIDTYRVTGERRRLLDSRRVRVHHGRFSARIPIGKRSRRAIVVIARTGAGGGTLAGESPPLSVDR